MSSTFGRFSAIICLGLEVAGCGTVAPQIQEAWDRDIPGDRSTNTPPVSGTAQIEFEIKRRIYCDLKDAFLEAKTYPVTEGVAGTERIASAGLVPPNWGAQISLSLQVDESFSLNPTLSVYPIDQSFTFGVGGKLSSVATRIDKFDPYYSVAYLEKPYSDKSICYPENDPFRRVGIEPAQSSPLIVSSLGIKDWLIGSMVTHQLLHSSGSPPKGSKAPSPDTITLELKFIIESSGNINPVWKLVRLSANANSNPFFGAGRTRTHDLIITVGPQSTEAAQTHFASQIGQAVSGANRALLNNR